jgi:hypothetical protein
LVERLLCKQEVDGSIPFISTEEAAGHSVIDWDLRNLHAAIHFIGHFMAKQKETKCCSNQPLKSSVAKLRALEATRRQEKSSALKSAGC